MVVIHRRRGEGLGSTDGATKRAEHGAAPGPLPYASELKLSHHFSRHPISNGAGRWGGPDDAAFRKFGHPYALQDAALIGRPAFGITAPFSAGEERRSLQGQPAPHRPRSASTRSQLWITGNC